MKMRAIAISLVAVLWTGAAQASVLGQVAGAVAVTVVSSAIAKRRAPKIATCTLYDKAGNPVTVSCPADVAAANAAPPTAPAPAPVAVAAAPLPPLQGGRHAVAVGPGAPPASVQAGGGVISTTYLSGGLPEARCIKCVVEQPAPPPPPPVVYAPPPPPVHYAPPPVYATPVVDDCRCEHREYRDERVYQPRNVASFLSVSDETSVETSYRRLGVVDSYEVYDSASHYDTGLQHGAARGYVGGLSGGVGYGFEGGYAHGGGVGMHPYGAVGAGGYAGGGNPYRARVAGRDPNGFLTWPGKR